MQDGEIVTPIHIARLILKQQYNERARLVAAVHACQFTLVMISTQILALIFIVLHLGLRR